jgi:hypothetical protein
VRAFTGGRILRHLLLFEAYYLLYVTMIPLVALFSRKVVWKERKL